MLQKRKAAVRKAALAALTLAVGMSLSVSPANETAAAKQDPAAQQAVQELLSASIGAKEGGYEQYQAQYASASHPDGTVVIPADSYASVSDMTVETVDGYEGMAGKSVKTGEQGTITWNIDVPADGLYNIGITYFPIEGKSASIERGLSIDGTTPFGEAADLQISRVWGNAKDKLDRDNQGNELRPDQIEKPTWQEDTLHDGEGFFEKPFSFYFTRGKHALSLTSEREPLMIKQLKLFQVEEPKPYAEVKKTYDSAGYKAAEDAVVKVQGEEAAYKSSPTLYPLTDHSTPAVEPYNVKEVRINTIGGYNWRMPGQWIAWNITVPKTGLYKIAVNSKQSFLRGLYSTRKLTLDGKVPFKEMEAIPFYYASDYKSNVLGGDDPYLFYLTAGTHELKLEATLGDVAELIRNVEDSVLTLNDMYRKILMITGSSPDGYRDYQLEKQIPDMVETFGRESKRLNAVASKLETITGDSSEQEATLHTMADQLADMAKKPDTVPDRLTSYNTNVGALGTWILQVREQPLQIDSITAASPDKKLPKPNASFFDKARHEIRTFFSSFVIDYNSIGNVSKGNESRSITVWVGSGRDQAQVLKAMIDDTFTPKTGINVNLKLVQMNVLLPATLAKQGPDVALQVGSDIPVNYAMRNAVADLSKFADFNAVAERFRDSALVPYRYEEGVYALPETQTFPMLFYRKDVLEKLHAKVPGTWEDVYNLMPVLNKNHMEFGLMRPVQLQAWQNPDPNSTMAMLLYQLGGEFYGDDGKTSALDSEEGEKAFKMWTEFYTDYDSPKEFDFANRFRTGEMPIGIADYTTYNQLSVFAPEIRGEWGFAPVPGTKQEDGTVHHDVAAGGSGAVIMKQAKDPEAGWEFLKWWTDEATQTKFGREMEGLMGEAARYPTANIEAFAKLPWPVADFRNLNEQFKSVRGIPQVPGGYFTGRHLDNAFWKVVNGTGGTTQKTWYKPWVSINSSTGPRETLDNYVQNINDEIKTKRKEFNLDN